ncbi:MAG: hypothetical protein PHS93_08765 [Candidatus Omnitrophica bacterium]|nr:hypothetical protein [Candidatus Omnitrophota bacterium]
MKKINREFNPRNTFFLTKKDVENLEKLVDVSPTVKKKSHIVRMAIRFALFHLKAFCEFLPRASDDNKRYIVIEMTGDEKGDK